MQQGPGRRREMMTDGLTIDFAKVVQDHILWVGALLLIVLTILSMNYGVYSIFLFILKGKPANPNIF